MNKVINIKEAILISKDLRKQNKKIVLVGGCFDILHIGHVQFLEQAKKQGDSLFVLVESDERVRGMKGESRPINSQKERTIIVAALRAVDYCIVLPLFKVDKDYDSLLLQLKPAIIAITKGDIAKKHKVRQAHLIGGKVVEVAQKIPHKSTSRLAEFLYQEL